MNDIGCVEIIHKSGKGIIYKLPDGTLRAYYNGYLVAETRNGHAVWLDDRDYREKGVRASVKLFNRMCDASYTYRDLNFSPIITVWSSPGRARVEHPAMEIVCRFQISPGEAVLESASKAKIHVSKLTSPYSGDGWHFSQSSLIGPNWKGEYRYRVHIYNKDLGKSFRADGKTLIEARKKAVRFALKHFKSSIL